MANISQLPFIGKNDLYNTFLNLIESQPKAIDSLKLRISLYNVKVINEVLGDDYYVFSKRTGEEITDENFKRNAYFHEEFGCKTFYKIENQINKQGIVLPYLTILFTSKILGADYFKGIQKPTLFQVYENIIKQEIVYMTFEDFMFGECTDTDVKIDLIPRVEAKDVINTIYSLAKPKKLAIEACSVYRQKSNLGIQFALRKTPKYIKAPYLKFYEKIRELKSKSIEFKENHLLKFELPNEVLRVETTIKNKKHFKHLGQDNTTLNSVEFSEQLLTSKNLINDTPKKGIYKLNIKERLIHNNIKKNIDLGFNFKEACEAVVSDCCITKEERYKMRKSIKKIFSMISEPIGENRKVCLSTFQAVMTMVSSDSMPSEFRA